MFQEAIITKNRDDGLAEVVVERLGICGGDCNGCNECKYEHLMKSVVQNPIGAHRGQHVMIETPTKGVVKGALTGDRGSVLVSLCFLVSAGLAGFIMHKSFAFAAYI